MPDASRWIAVNASARSVTLSLIVGYDGAANGLNLDGAVKGALLFAAPAGWQVRARCANRSSGRAACVVDPAPGGHSPPLPASERGPQPPGGLAPLASAVFALPASRPGLYRLSAVLGGREPAGMWVAFEVTRGGRPFVR